MLLYWLANGCVTLTPEQVVKMNDSIMFNDWFVLAASLVAPVGAAVYVWVKHRRHLAEQSD